MGPTQPWTPSPPPHFTSPTAPAAPDRAGPAPAPATLPRRALGALLAAPLLAHFAPGAAFPAAAAAAPRLRPLTPEEAAAVETALAAAMTPAKAPVMLRLVFHDAGTYDAASGTGGPNASVRFELDRPENFGLKRGWGVIDAAAKKLKGTPAEGAVGLADLVALAGARAVRITGGPDIAVPVGRADAAAADPADRMPAETFSAPQQLAAFARMGLAPDEFVALSGSHTLGSKGYGDPLTFDNTYFVSLLKKPWENKADPMADMVGIPSDHVLPGDPTCAPIIERYAADQGAFFADFGAAYLKLTALGHA